MLYDCRSPADRDRGIAAAIEAVKNGELVVLPTDTVYGIGADAFTPYAVKALLDAKGRSRQMPPPVLIGSRHTLDGLVFSLPTGGPGPGGGVLAGRADHRGGALAEPRSGTWATPAGTVAVRMPLHPVALEVLRETGPMAVSSANKIGQPAAVTAEEARDQLGYSVRAYLEAGPCPDPVPSTIVDLTGEVPRLLRAGAIPLEKLRDVVPDILDERGA